MTASAASILLRVPPIPRTRLIGREAEQETARGMLLDEAVPLLTLTGPGGVGKTRLALAIAAQVGDHFTDGVLWVALAPLTDPALVPAAVATAVALTPVSDQPLTDELARFLRSRQMLLLLDNCEHVLGETAALVAVLLSACPALQVLATSRAPLRIRGEHELAIDPLPVPPADVRTDPDQLVHNAAVCLFLERARAVRPALPFDEATAPAVAAVCRALDGLPLAIELAATRIKLLSPELLLAHMQDRRLLLSSGARDLPPRQRTIHDTIAWSYDLLDEEDQSVFRRLAIFAGGWTLEAAAAVCELPLEPMIDRLESLVDQSLVVRQLASDPTHPRFTMLETIRAFALERVAAAGEADTLRDAHAIYFVALGERADPNRVSAAERIDHRLLDLELELANVRTALNRLKETGDADRALQLAGALAIFWQLRGHVHEGRQWLEWGLARATPGPTADRGRGLAALGLLQWSRGAYEQADASAQASLEIAEAIGDRAITALALHVRGDVAQAQGRWAHARPIVERTLELWRELGDQAGAAWALVMLSQVYFGLGEVESAETRANEALTHFRQLGHAVGAAKALGHLGDLARARGDDLAAARAYQEALQLCISVSDRWFVIGVCAGLAELAGAHGLGEQVAMLVGAVHARADHVGGSMPQLASERIERAAAETRAVIGEDRFVTFYATGRALRQDDMVSLAHAVIAAILAGSSFTSAPTDLGPAENLARTSVGFGLTRREREILCLLVQRRTDLEIAERLFISPKTAGKHVSNILGKMGAANRRDAAAIAVRSGFV